MGLAWGSDIISHNCDENSHARERLCGHPQPTISREIPTEQRRPTMDAFKPNSLILKMR
jgi:hypothetical protein